MLDMVSVVKVFCCFMGHIFSLLINDLAVALGILVRYILLGYFSWYSLAYFRMGFSVDFFGYFSMFFPCYIFDVFLEAFILFCGSYFPCTSQVFTCTVGKSNIMLLGVRLSKSLISFPLVHR